MRSVTPELIGIVTVGIALAGLNLTIATWLRSDIRDLRITVEGLVGRVADVEKRVAVLDHRVEVLDQRVSLIEDQLNLAS